jgi:hypothetical protein
MAEEKLQMRPFVQIACICQTFLQEANGAISVIRVLDRIGIPGFTPQMQPTPLQNLVLLLVLKSGQLRETHPIKVVPVTPSGKQERPIIETNGLFQGDELGVISAAPIAMVINEEGPYWFDVYVEEELVTRIPLRVVYQRLPMPMPMQQPPTG